MKRILLPALILIFNVAWSQNVGIGTGSPAAKLDITSANSGVLIPRVALTATNIASPLTSPAVSTLIYNIAAAGTGATAVVPGFYYWNGSAWVLVIDNSSLSGSTTVSNISSANNLSTTVNGVTGSTVPIVNSLSNISSANTLSTTVNGVTGSTVPIINSNTLSLSGNTLTSDVNGVSPTQSLSGLTLSGDVTGTLGATTISQIQGTGMAISSLAPNNILQYNGTNWVNVTPASILGSTTTVGNTSSANTLSTTVNGVTGSTVPMVNSISNTSSANTISTNVNGVAGSTVPIVNSISNVSSVNSLSTTVNGIAGSTVPIVNSISNTSSANTLSTTVNGVAGSTVPIINSNALSQNGSDQLISTTNGVASTALTVAVAGDVTGNLGASTVAKIQGTPVTVSSLANGNLLQYNSSGTDWVNVTPASVLAGATTVSNTSSANTLSTTVNGVAGSTVPIVNSISNASSANTLSTTVNGVAGSTVPIVNSISNTSSVNTLSTTVNGVAGSTVPIVNSISNFSGVNSLSTTVNGIAGSTVPIINSNALSLSGSTLTSTINGVASTGLNIATAGNNIYNTDGTLTGSRTVTMGADNLTFSATTGNLIFNPSSGGNVGIGTATPGVNRLYSYTVNAASATSGNLTGARGEADIAANSYTNSTAIGLDAYASAGGSNTGGTFTGDKLYGVHSIVYSAWGAVPSAYGLYAQAQVATYQSITNYYGLYLDAELLATGGVITTNNYGVYQASTAAQNYFAGNVGIGTASPGINKLYAVTANASSATSGNLTGVRGEVDVAGNSYTGSTIIGLDGYVSATGSSTAGTFTTDNLIGVRGVVYSGWGTVSTAYGLYAQAQTFNYQNISTYCGLYLATENLSTGGAISSNYGVYQASTAASNYFAGKVGIANASPSYVLDVTGEARFTGSYTTSDRRYKQNISNLQNSLDKIEQLQGVSYDWRKDEFPDLHFNDRKQIGLIAQEVEKIIPEAVSIDNKGFYSINYPALVPVLIEAVKEQEKKIADEEAQIEQLKNDNASLKTSGNLNIPDIQSLQKQIDTLKELIEKNGITSLK